MPCYRPVKGYQNAPGEPLVFSRAQAVSSRVSGINVPCNSCVGCRLERARQWAMRCVDEASLHKENAFVTLTFNEANLPLNRSLDKSIFQRFMKRLRKSIAPKRVRYFHCGEYGPSTGRPHYHALLFGIDFPDRVFLKETASGEKIYRSKTLESLWPFGYSSVGDVTFGSAAYVARYHLKKVGGANARTGYVNQATGEVLEPEYVTMSRRPGIAAGWFDKFYRDVYPHDFRVVKGLDTKPAKFYDSLYERVDPVSFRRVKLRRMSSVNRLDNTDARLLVKEEVKLAQTRMLSSNLEA